MDTPWRGTLRQRLGRFKIGGYLSRMDRVVVAGERAWQLVRLLGVPEAKIRRGLYGVDYDTFAPLFEHRLAPGRGGSCSPGDTRPSKASICSSKHTAPIVRRLRMRGH